MAIVRGRSVTFLTASVTTKRLHRLPCNHCPHSDKTGDGALRTSTGSVPVNGTDEQTKTSQIYHHQFTWAVISDRIQEHLFSWNPDYCFKYRKSQLEMGFVPCCPLIFLSRNIPLAIASLSIVWTTSSMHLVGGKSSDRVDLFDFENQLREREREKKKKKKKEERRRRRRRRKKTKKDSNLNSFSSIFQNL